MKQFSPEKERAIEEKIELFWSAFKWKFYPERYKEELKNIEEKITQKRLTWFEENKDNLWYLKSDELIHIDKAAVLLFHEYMGIKFKDVKMKGPRGLIYQKFADADHERFFFNFHTRNFCPYLEAFKRLKLKPEQSVEMCKTVLHKPCEALVKKVDPRIRFGRDYETGFNDDGTKKYGIRPLNDYCSERLIIEDGELMYKLMYEDEDFDENLI